VPDQGLTSEQIASFIEDGYVHIEQAFPPDVAQAGQAILWELSGADRAEPDTWTEPVIRIDGSAAAPFQTAANTTKLQIAFDQLVGVGRWRPRIGLGTFPIRFPHPRDPGDTGWHLDGSYRPEGETQYWVNLQSRGRALLMLFLFSDVGPDDAPTRIKVGSHLDVPPFLSGVGERGQSFFDVCRAMSQAGKLDSPDRRTVLATGRAGDVYLCHPFLIHAAQIHRGVTPRFIAQPPLDPSGLLVLERPDRAYSPVEIAVRRGLGFE
jgi:hypothetical protein